MVLNAYMLLIIYARVGLTQSYLACLSCLLNVEEEITTNFDQKYDGRHVGFSTLLCRMYDTLIFF